MLGVQGLVYIMVTALSTRASSSENYLFIGKKDDRKEQQIDYLKDSETLQSPSQSKFTTFYRLVIDDTLNMVLDDKFFILQ